MLIHLLIKSRCACVCACVLTQVPESMWRPEDTFVELLFSSSTFKWVTGIELRLPGLSLKCIITEPSHQLHLFLFSAKFINSLKYSGCTYSLPHQSHLPAESVSHFHALFSLSLFLYLLVFYLHVWLYTTCMPMVTSIKIFWKWSCR